MAGRYVQVVERTIQPNVLEVADRIAGSDASFEDQRQLLAVALSDNDTVLGRAFALDGSIAGVELRRKVVGQWGERTSASLGATRMAGTLRHLGIISGGGNAGPYLPVGKNSEPEPEPPDWRDAVRYWGARRRREGLRSFSRGARGVVWRRTSGVAGRRLVR